MHQQYNKPYKLGEMCRKAVLAFAVGASSLFTIFISEVAMAQTYSTERILAISTEESGKYTRKKIDLGETGFSFSSILNDKMDIWTEEAPQEKEGVIARIYEPEDRDRLMIEVHRLRFPSFADAQTAGYGFLAINGYNRILQDQEKGNSVFGFLAGSEFKEGAGYSRMSRVAAISHGRDVLVIHAAFEYEDYPEYEDALSRFFGGIRMEDDGDAFASLGEEKAKGGESFLYPKNWDVKKVDSSGKPQGTSDYNLSLDGEEYPNLVVHIRPVDLTKGREVAAEMISKFTKQIDQSGQTAFSGDAEMQTIKNTSGETVAHAYARAWDMAAGGHFVSEIYVQKNTSPSISVLGLNTYDARRNIRSFDAEARQMIFNGWVTGVSAFSVAKISLGQERSEIERQFDLRAVGR